MLQGTLGTALLDPHDPPPFTIRRPRRDGARVIVVCDHASNRVPGGLATLGLPAHRLEQHIALDIGAAGVAKALADGLEAGYVLAQYSRLVVDLNRATSDPSVIPSISDGILIPGNLSLTRAQRNERIATLHAPYHAAIDGLLAERRASGEVPVMLAVHSFTPAMSDVPRPWHVGVLWDKDARVAIPLLDALRRRGDLIVGDNEPYSGRHPADYTIDHHAERLGYAHAAIEIRQDLITAPAEQRAWGMRLAGILGKLLRAAGGRALPDKELV